MDRNILVTIIFLLSAVCGVTPYIPHRYHFVDQNKSWDDARTYCREIYSDLATINNKEEMMKLNSILDGNDEAWIGLKKEGVGEWVWSLEGKIPRKSLGKSPLPVSVKTLQKYYKKWCDNEPDNKGGSEYCVVLEKAEKCWHDVPCESNYSYVCYEGTNKIYKLVNEEVTWCEAQRYCRANNTLMAIDNNQTEQQKIISAINQLDINRVWIGLFNNSCKWSDSSDFCFTNWKSNISPMQNQTHCVTVKKNDPNQSWKTDDCATKHRFVCHENQLILINQTLTWTEALKYCRKHHEDLVSAHTEEIQSLVMEVARNASTDHLWLGLVHTCTLGFWYWVSGESVYYQNWAPGNRTGPEDCSHGDRTGAVQSGEEQQWVSLTSNQKLNFICTTY